MNVADVTQFAKQLRSGDEETQKQAAIALGKSGHPAALSPLVAALHDEKRSVRRAAQDSLITLRDERAVEPLIEAAAEGRLDFNPVAYALERKFGVADAYSRTWEAVQAYGDMDVIAAAKPLYERWLARQS